MPCALLRINNNTPHQGASSILMLVSQEQFMSMVEVVAPAQPLQSCCSLSLLHNRHQGSAT
jgi:hypothetical protein